MRRPHRAVWAPTSIRVRLQAASIITGMLHIRQAPRHFWLTHRRPLQSIPRPSTQQMIGGSIAYWYHCVKCQDRGQSNVCPDFKQTNKQKKHTAYVIYFYGTIAFHLLTDRVRHIVKPSRSRPKRFAVEGAALIKLFTSLRRSLTCASPVFQQTKTPPNGQN